MKNKDQTQYMVDVQNLTVVYPGKIEPAVDQFSLQVRQGEFFGLLGPNGAGKTTIINAMSSLLKPTNGRILINDLDIKANLTEIKKLIGVVAQDIALYDKLTAYENLVYFGSLYGIENNNLKTKIYALIERLGLTPYLHKRIKAFSGGMKRRVNLVAGMLHEPQLLVLDEPVTGVDVHSRNVIREFLKEVNEKGTSIIYTSHIMEDVEKLCSRIYIIDYGKIIEQGTISELLNRHSDCKLLEDVFLKLTGHKLRDK